MSDVDKFEYACYERFLSMLHRIAGYIECGEGEAVKIFRDDATKNWHVKVGSVDHWGYSLKEAFEKALVSSNDYYQKSYGLIPLTPPRHL